MASSENLMSKQQNFSKGEDDMLNDVLPAHVVSHILSCLPTKEAIKTSILSKRWRFLWTGISNLDFSDEHEVNRAYYAEDGNTWIDEGNRSGVARDNFINYVSSVLLRLDPTYSIDKFSIFLGIYPDVLQIEKWISSAIEHNVKDLSLLLDTYNLKEIVLPRKVFGCKSVEALRLSGLHLKIPKRGLVCFPNLKFLSLELNVCISGIPAAENSPCFPNLKTLHLKYVNFLGKDDCVMKLIRNCSLLEDLSIRRVFEHNVSNVDMRIPQLTSVHLDCGIVPVCGLNVRIEAPIKYLTISNWNPTHKIIVSNPDYFIRAELGSSFTLKDYDFQGEQGDGLFNLLKTVGSAKCLIVPFEWSKVIKASGIKLPLLSNVTRLELALFYKNLFTLECFLNSTINLQILVIKISRQVTKEEGEDVPCPWSGLSNVPKCLTGSLKRVEIYTSLDCPIDLDMIKDMLESAEVLEVFTVWVSLRNRNKSDFESLRRKISQFPRASALCQVDTLQRQSSSVSPGVQYTL